MKRFGPIAVKIVLLSIVTIGAAPATATKPTTRAARTHKVAKRDPQLTAKIQAIKAVNPRDLDWHPEAAPTLNDPDFVTAVDAILKVDPQAFDTRAKLLPDGSFDVDDQGKIAIFFWTKQKGEFRKVWERVDGAGLVAEQKGLLGIVGRPALPLLHRAYLDYRLDPAAGAGRPSDVQLALEALSGQATPVAVKPTPPLADELYATVAKASSEGRVMLATAAGHDLGQRIHDAVWTRLTDEQANGMTLAAEGLGAGRTYALFDTKRVMMSLDELYHAKAAGLIGDQDVESDGENRFVRFLYLRNATSTSSDHGLFRMPIRKFAILFNRVLVGQPVAPADQRQAQR